MGEIEAALAELTFERHFIECLGWDRVRDQFIPAFPLETLSRRCTRPPTDPASVEAMTDSYRSPTTATRKPPTDPVSVEAMTDSYRSRATATRKPPTDPVSVEAMTGSYGAALHRHNRQSCVSAPLVAGGLCEEATRA